MRRLVLPVVLAVVAITPMAARVSAHVAPSVDDNNRYLKLSPMGDRVRLAYTVFFGEVPGAKERRTIDANGDGQIEPAESERFGKKIAAEVAANLDVEVDGKTDRVTWAVVDVGMGTPVTAAGSFSVDLVAYLCLPSVGGAHRVVIRDHFRVPHPGETEVKVEDTPGVKIDHARIAEVDDPSHDYKFVGAGGPLSDSGIDLAFTASDKAPVEGGACTGAPAAASGSNSSGFPRWLLTLIGLAGCALVGVVVALLKR